MEIPDALRGGDDVAAGKVTMASSHEVEREGPVARLILRHPPRNTLDVPLMRALEADVRRMAALPAQTRPRVLVLASAVAGHFSHGIDPEAVLSTDVYGRKKIFQALADLVEALWF